MQRVFFTSCCSGTLAPSPLVGGWWAVRDGGCEGRSSGLLEAAGCRDETGVMGPDGTGGSSSAPRATASGGSGSLSSATASETSSDVHSAIAMWLVQIRADQAGAEFTSLLKILW
jgi:hypothetical protein